MKETEKMVINHVIIPKSLKGILNPKPQRALGSGFPTEGLGFGIQGGNRLPRFSLKLAHVSKTALLVHPPPPPTERELDPGCTGL